MAELVCLNVCLHLLAFNGSQIEICIAQGCLIYALQGPSHETDSNLTNITAMILQFWCGVWHEASTSKYLKRKSQI